MSKTRQLAAIMFTDIQGYTALMQQDEKRAIEIRERHREIFNNTTKKFNGKILQYYGDGTLSIFNSAVDAVNCAIRMQLAFQQEPVIPVRIGIHLGDIIYSDEEIIGDGVNVASRIESLAVPGSIFISDKVYDEIKNQPKIQTQSLKTFELKNVERPVEVFAISNKGLVIPKAYELDGTAEEKEEKHDIFIEEKYERKIPGDLKEHIPARKPKKRLITILSGLLLACVIVIVALVVFNIIGGGKQTKELEKSIAVRPFKSLSDDPEKQYLADGVMDAILLHLSKIEDLRVMARTSVEQYRETHKTASIICQELDVAYLLEGSFQKYGDNARLIVQLIKTGKEGHVWANEYDRNWNDIFSVQSEVAQTIARELQAAITPEEKQLIEKIPTANLTAYDFYQRGREEYLKYQLDNDNREALERAEDLYRKALEYDSTFAQAYTGLAWVYRDKYYWKTFFSEEFLDSVLILTNIALSYDDQLSEAYTIKGRYYRSIGIPEQAVKEYDKALKLSPNDWMAYYYKGIIYRLVLQDYIKSIENLHEAVIRNRGEDLPKLLYSLGFTYINIGFIDKAKYYYQEAFTLDGDSANYFINTSWLEFSLENYEKAVVFLEKALKTDSADIPFDPYYTYAGQHKEAYIYYTKLIERYKKSGSLPLEASHRIGYAFWKVGKYKEAEYYFNEQIKYGTESIKLGRDIASWMAAHYDLAGVYAFLGDKVKAYQYLDEFDKKNFYPLWWISMAKHDPLFNSIREEERFQKILLNMEAKYQAEHERVRVWLEKEGML